MGPRILLLAIPLSIAPWILVACGDLAASSDPSSADGGASSSSGGPSGTSSSGGASSGSLPDAAVLDAAAEPTLAACSPSPQLLATIEDPNADAKIERIAVGEAGLAFVVARSPQKRELHAVSLGSGAATMLVDSGGALAPTGTDVGVVGTEAFYLSTSGTAVNGHVLTRVGMDGDAPPATVPAAGTPSHISASADGVLYFDGLRGGADLQTTRFGSWIPAADTVTSFTGDGAPSNGISAFTGGFVAMVGIGTVLGRDSTRTVELTEPFGRCIAFDGIRATPTAEIGFVIAQHNTCSSSPITLEGRTCDTPADGPMVCNASGPRWEGKPTLTPTDFAPLAEGALAIAVIDSSAKRSVGRVLLRDEAGERVIGGDTATANVDAITTLTNRGDCIYWGEKNATGLRILRAHR